MEKPPRTFLKQLKSVTLCGKPGDALLLALEHFHGDQTPGLILGAIMVDWAFELLGIGSDPKAVVESRYFLSDAVQQLTPCTVGNGRLVTLDWDKMALSLFDRRRMAGYRVWLDLKKTRSSPPLYTWQMRLPLPPGTSSGHVISDILRAGRAALSHRAIPITKTFSSPREDAMGVCPQCDEAYPLRQGDRCRACRGESYYELPPSDHPPSTSAESPPGFPTFRRLL
jgi:formylmethanofuran dehydrogenase subunit E